MTKDYPLSSIQTTPNTISPPKTIRHLWMQYLIGFIVTTIALVDGTSQGWFSSTVPKLTDGRGPFNVTSSEISWIFSIENIGTICSAFFLGLSMQYFDRKYLLVLYNPLLLIGLIVLYYANSAMYLYVTKLIIGSIEPIKYTVTAFYLGEIADKSLRGRLFAMNKFMGRAGETISLIISAYLGYNDYIAVLMSLTVISFFSIIFIPKSPYFQTLSGNRNGALKSFKILNRNIDETCLEQELDIMEDKIGEDMKNKSSFLEFIKSPSAKKAIIMLLGLKTFLSASGIKSIHQYLQLIVHATNSNISTNLSAIIGCTLQGVGIFISYFLIDRIGRKPLLYVSCTGSAILLFVLGLYFFLHQFYSDLILDDATWVPVIALYFYEFLEAIETQIAWILLGELFTMNMKEKIIVVNEIYLGCINFCISKLFGVLSTSMGLYLTFWICCSFMILGIVFIVFVVMETKGQSLQEVQENLKK